MRTKLLILMALFLLVAAVPAFAGWVWPNDHTGCVPFGDAIVTRMRDPARYAWPS